MTATNVSIGRAVDLAPSTISRIRSGDRLPSVMAMAAIREVFGWSIDSQVQARQAGQYAAEFERQVQASQRRDSGDQA